MEPNSDTAIFRPGELQSVARWCVRRCVRRLLLFVSLTFLLAGALYVSGHPITLGHLSLAAWYAGLSMAMVLVVMAGLAVLGISINHGHKLRAELQAANNRAASIAQDVRDHRITLDATILLLRSYSELVDGVAGNPQRAMQAAAQANQITTLLGQRGHIDSPSLPAPRAIDDPSRRPPRSIRLPNPEVINNPMV